MRRRALFAATAAACLLAGAVWLAYHHDLRQAHADLEGRSLTIGIEAGPVEYAFHGEGPPLLSIHGSGGGFDQGQANAEALIGEGFLVIAPSRFGYLRTPLPPDTASAAQADAHAAMLDALAMEKVVVLGASAGARSAVQLAIRHPDKVAALVLAVPATYWPDAESTPAGQSSFYPLLLRIVSTGGDFLWWAAMEVMPSALVRFIGVPPALLDTVSDEERRDVLEMVRRVLPLSERFQGIAADSVPEADEPDFAQISAPTLILSARDDLFDTLPPAEYAASRIPGARLIVYETGGHLLLGHGDDVREAIRQFLVDAGLPPAGG